MKILIAGAGGYVGSLLCGELLNRGYYVRAVDNFSRNNCDALIPYCSYRNFEFIRGDITDEEFDKKIVQGVDAIINLAALVGAPVCERNKEMAWQVNAFGAKKLIKYKSETTKYLFASTGSVYGQVQGVCTEESPLNTLSIYGQTKKKAEDLILDYPNTVAYRFSTGYGVSPNIRVDLLVNDLVYRAIHEKAIIIFQSDFRRTFIHVRDMVASFIWGIENFHKFTHLIYNVGGENGNCTKRELAELIKKKTNCLVTYADDGYVDPDQRDYKVDFSLINECGWHSKIELENAIDELIKVASILNPASQYVEKL